MTAISFGQSVKIDTFRVKESSRFKEIQSGKMNFPIIRTNNKEVDAIINADIKNRFTGNEFSDETLESTFEKWADDRIIYLDFNVTYNQNGLISFSVTAEGCGAYCTSWTEYFTYSATTGKWLLISDIIEMSEFFTKKVEKDKDSLYLKQKKELKEMLEDPTSGLNEETYKWALEYYQECQAAFNLDSFFIHSNGLSLVQNCYLPNAIKNLTPLIYLTYSIEEIEKYTSFKYIIP